MAKRIIEAAVDAVSALRDLSRERAAPGLRSALSDRVNLVAAKAARCVLAAPGKLLVDFGLRRAHGAEAGLMAARASYLAGFAGTATVLAGERFAPKLRCLVARAWLSWILVSFPRYLETYLAGAGQAGAELAQLLAR